MPEAESKTELFSPRSGLRWLRFFLRGREHEFFLSDPDGYENVVVTLAKRREVARVVRLLVENRLERNDFETILDTACGTGIITEELSNCGASDARIIGLDPSRKALEYAQEHRGCNVEWMEGDFNNLQGVIEDESIDLYHMFVAYRFADPERFWSEVQRVLKPGGIALLPRFIPDMPNVPFRRRLDEAVRLCKSLGMEPEVIEMEVAGWINRLCVRNALIVRKPDKKVF